MKKIRIGLMGTGFMGKMHTFSYQNLKYYYEGIDFTVELAGVYARNKEKGQAFADKYGFEYATDDPMALINDKSIDVIDISLPNDLHEKYAIAAIEAGKHIYLEKPVALNAESAERIAAAAEKKGVSNQVVFHNRFFPSVIRAKQLIDEGKIGRIHGFNFFYNHAVNTHGERPMAWRFTTEAGGGTMMDMGSHMLDMVYYLLGEFDEISAKMQILFPTKKDENGVERQITVDDAAYMLIKMKDGAIGMAETSKVATGTCADFRFEIYGEAGALKFDMMDVNFLYYYDNAGEPAPLGGNKGFKAIESTQRYPSPAVLFPQAMAPIGWDRGHTASIFNFLSSVTSGSKAHPSVKDGAYIQRAIDKAFESSKKGCWVKI